MAPSDGSVMRVVVIGPYPPSADPAADDVLAGVRALRSDASVVAVVSPVPSAAGATGDPTTWVGAVRVRRVVRSADRVIWYAPADVRPAYPLRRALATVPRFERRVIALGTERRRRGFVWWLRLVRAGAPTLVRTVAARRR